MFKKLKEKVSTVTNELQSAKTTIQGLNSQASQYIDQLVNNSSNSSVKDETESDGKESLASMASTTDKTADLLQLNDESNNANNSSLDQFSLVELDDDSPTHSSQTSHSLKTNTSVVENDSFFTITPIMSPSNYFVPQSDIESEYESETHSRFQPLDNVSKQQLLELCMKLKERGKKYRDRWTEVVKAYRLLNDEREKMKKVLADTQDKALRRINEMKEQSNLEVQAKRHLEENLRIVIEEKDEKIKVLQTKIGLLNDNQMNDETNDLLDLKTNEDKTNECIELKEKVERLEQLLTRCKESLKTNKEKLNILSKENEKLLDIKEDYEKVSKDFQQLKSQTEGHSLSFAESKHKLHEELEARNIVVRELQNQIEEKKRNLVNFESDLNERGAKIAELEERIVGIERTTEEDKQNLIQELSRGKSAAIHLIREETEKKLLVLDEEWKQKYETLVNEKQDLNRLLTEMESNNKQLVIDDNRRQVEETNEQNQQLKNEIKECQTKLNETIDELKRAEECRETEKRNLEILLSDSEKKSLELLGEIERLNERSTNLDEYKLQLQKTESLLRNAEQTTDDARHELESLRIQLQDKEVLMNQLRDEKRSTEEELKQRFSSLQKELEDRNTSALSLEESIKLGENDLKNKLIVFENELIVSKKTINELENSVKQREDVIQELKQNNESLETDMNHKIEKQLFECLNKCSNLEQILSEKELKIEELNKDLNEKCLKLNEFCKQSEENEKQLIDMKSHLNEKEMVFKNDVKISEQTISELQIDLKSVSEKCENYIKEIECLSNEKCIFDNKYTEIETKNNETIEENNDLKQELIELKTVLKDCREKVKQIEEKSDSDINQLIQSERQNCLQLSQTIESLNNNIIELKEQLVYKESQIKNIQTLNENILSENQSLKQSLDEKEVLIKQLNSSEETNCLKENELKTELETKDKLIFDLNNEIKTSEEKVNSISIRFESEMSKNKSVLMKLEEEFNELNIKYKDVMELNDSVSLETNRLVNEIKNIKELNELLEKQLNEEKTKQKEGLENSIKFNEEFKCLEDINNDLNAKYNELKPNFEFKCNENNELLSKVERLETDSKQFYNDFHNNKEIIENLKSELNDKNKSFDDLLHKNELNTKTTNDLNEKIRELSEELIKYSNIESELKESFKANEELKTTLSEKTIEFMTQIDVMKNEMSKLKEQNQSVVEKLHKKLDLSETQLDESLMAVESRYNSTAQELIEAKSLNSKLKQELEEIQSKNVGLEKEVQELTQNMSEIERKVGYNDENEEKNNILIEKINYFETKLMEKDNEFEEKLENFHKSEDKMVFELKKQISSLENEVSDKNSALEEVHEYYQQRLKDKDNELQSLHSEFGSSTVNEHTYQVKAMQNSLLQYQEENLRLKELLNIRRFAESQHSENTPLITGVHLPEPTEYEYLRNILYEFMIGREPVTLAKVIAAVMRFNVDQTEQIIKKQESNNQLISLRQQFKPI